MGRSCPLQKAQPLGGKFQLITLTSPKNGSDMFHLPLMCSRLSFPSILYRIWPRGPLCGRRKDPKQRKNKVDYQKWDHVVMGLRSTRQAYCSRIHVDAGTATRV